MTVTITRSAVTHVYENLHLVGEWRTVSMIITSHVQSPLALSSSHIHWQSFQTAEHWYCTIKRQLSKNDWPLTNNESLVSMEMESKRKQQWLLTLAGNEMIIPRRWNGCQGVTDLDSSQSYFLFPLLRVDKSKQETCRIKRSVRSTFLSHFTFKTHMRNISEFYPYHTMCICVWR